MTVWETTRSLGILGPIVAMLVVGLIVAARSGVSRLDRSAGLRRAGANLSHTVLMVGGCLFGLAVLHRLVGYTLPPIR